MGDRCVITTNKKEIGVYLHWHGKREYVEAFLAYCKMKGIRSPEKDNYGWSRLCQVIANFIGNDGLSVGIDTFENLRDISLDNGVYIIADWKIIAREDYSEFEECSCNFDSLLYEINEAQPENERIDFRYSAVE